MAIGYWCQPQTSLLTWSPTNFGNRRQRDASVFPRWWLWLIGPPITLHSVIATGFPRRLKTSRRCSLPKPSRPCGVPIISAVDDHCCRENLGLVGDTSISCGRDRPDTLVRPHGKAACIVSDNGSQAGLAISPSTRAIQLDGRNRVDQSDDPDLGQREKRRVRLHRPR